MPTFKIKVINEADPTKSTEQVMSANHQGELLKTLRQMGIKKFEILGVDNDGSGQGPTVVSTNRPGGNYSEEDVEGEITKEKPAPMIQIPKEFQQFSQNVPGQPVPGSAPAGYSTPFGQLIGPGKRGEPKVINTNAFENDGVKFKVDIYSDGSTVTYKKDWIDVIDLSEYQVTIGAKTYVYKENCENKVSIRKLDWIVISDTRKKPESKEVAKKN